MAAPALTGGALAAANARVAFEALFAGGPAAATASTQLAGSFTIWSRAATILGGALRLLSGPIGWIVTAGGLLLTASGSWGSFFRILSAGASIISTLVVLSFNRLAEVVTAVIDKLGAMGRAVASIPGAAAILRGLGAGFKWSADQMENFAFQLGGMKGPAAALPGALNPAAVALKTFKDGVANQIIQPVQSADNALKLLGMQTAAGVAGLNTLVGPANLLTAGPLKSLALQAEAASQKSDEFAKALATLRDQLSGADLLDKAKQYEIVIKGIGGASKLTAAETTEVAATYTAVIEKYQAIGGAVGAKTVAHFQALLAVLPPNAKATEDFAKAVEGIRGKFSGSDLLDKAKQDRSRPRQDRWRVDPHRQRDRRGH